MSLHSWSNPGIERGDGLDHGVETSISAWRALIIERTHSSIPELRGVRHSGESILQRLLK
jgi:hypothetical protein